MACSSPNDPGTDGVRGQERNGLILDVRKRRVFQIAHHMRRHAVNAGRFSDTWNFRVSRNCASEFGMEMGV